MSREIIVIGAFLSLTACVPEEAGPIAITAFFDAPGDCKLPTDTSIRAVFGELGVVASAAPSLNLGFKITSAPGPMSTDLTVGGTTLQTANLDLPLIDSMVVQFQATPTLRLPKYTLPMTLSFDKNVAVVGYLDIIGSAAGAVLQDIDRDYQLTANVDFQGHMSRSAAVVSTGPRGFPIQVKSLGACTKPGVGYGTGYNCISPGTQDAPACCDGVVSGKGCP